MTTIKESAISYCGFYCDDCWIKEENVSDLAAKMIDKIKSTEFKNMTNGLPKMLPMFKGLSNYNECVEMLEAACFIQCHANCRQGGGMPNCIIRECCVEKNKEGCWECDEYESCEKLAWIEPVHSDAAKKNIETIKDSGIDGYLKGEKYW